MQYKPTDDFNGEGHLEITVNDQGHTGSGGAKEANAIIDITINPTHTLMIEDNNSILTFNTNDGAIITLAFLEGNVAGYMVSFESFGFTPPSSVMTVPPFDIPLLYLNITTTIPDTESFLAKITIEYTNEMLTAAGVTDETTLGVAWFDEANARWNLVDVMIDPDQNMAMFNTSHFSVWALASVIPTGIDDDGDVQRPQAFALGQNAPNPFNPSTTIRYSLPRTSTVRLTVYNLLGQQVRVLKDGPQPAGDYMVLWNGQDRRGRPVSSGVYLYRLTTEHFIATKRMLLLK
jgi:hypothetical protein